MQRRPQRLGPLVVDEPVGVGGSSRPEASSQRPEKRLRVPADSDRRANFLDASTLAALMGERRPALRGVGASDSAAESAKRLERMLNKDDARLRVLQRQGDVAATRARGAMMRAQACATAESHDAASDGGALAGALGGTSAASGCDGVVAGDASRAAVSDAVLAAAMGLPLHAFRRTRAAFHEVSRGVSRDSNWCCEKALSSIERKDATCAL